VPEQSPGNQTSLAMMQEPQEMVEETVTVEEDPGTPTSHVSIVTSEDGTTRRTETKVTKMVKTVTTRTVRQVPLGPDGLPLLDGSPPLGSYTDSIDRRYLKNGERFLPPQASSTLTRSYNSYGEGPDGPYRPFHAHDASAGYGGAELPDGYGSLSRGVGYRPRYAYVPGGGYRPEEGSYTLPGRREAYGPPGAQPQAPPVGSGPDLAGGGRSQPERFQPEPYGLEDDNRSLGVDDEGYELDPDYSTVNRRLPVGGSHPRAAYEEPSESEMIDERIPYVHGGYAAPLAQPERGSMASIDRLGKRSPSIDSIRKDPRWRDPDLPEVIAMLSHPIDPVKSNAAAYLQHLCYENDKIKKDVRHLKGIAILVGLLDHPKAEVHRRACGALRNISYGRDHENKVAIKGCDGIPALIRLLRKTNDMEVRELITGTLWNLSSYEPLKMVIINHGLQTLTNEVIVPHSGWESEPNEDSKPRDAEWTTVFKNTSGCLRWGAQKGPRECDGLVDALLHALQSAIGKKDTDNKVMMPCNLGLVGGQGDRPTGPAGRQPGRPRKKDDASCFGSKKAKGKKNGGVDRNFDTLDLPKRSESAKGFELLYQPEVVRLYLSILTESQNFNTLEAAAGALQNLSAGTWMVSGGARAREKGLGAVGGAGPVRLRVGGATALGARRPLLATRGGDLQLGSYAMAELVRNLPSRQQRTAKNLEEDTVVAVLNTIHEIITDSAENARSLVQTQGIQKLVGIGKSSPSMRETKAASHVLQMVWSYKELRGALQKDGWNKAHFQVSVETPPSNGTTPSCLVDERCGSRDMIPMDELGPDGYSTIDHRERKYRAGDPAGDASEKEPLKVSGCWGSLP
uniref:ARVCF delta catenin family member n=1 Tax=Sarcophilus harrisii TaxID=9305 RepID=G3VNY1_SARHA